MNVREDHWLDEAIRDVIEGGAEMAVRRCVVEHFTAGATAKSSIEAMRDRGLSAHLVIDRDGKIFQCRPFNRTCAHAGSSRWKDPKSGELFRGLNSCSIGIEIANAGNDDGALSWARRQPGFQSIHARHRNGGREVEWEVYPEAQMNAVIAVTKALVARYNLDDVTGHDCIAPERKDDPGPAFPMREVRELCGFSGLPTVHHP